MAVHGPAVTLRPGLQTPPPDNAPRCAALSPCTPRPHLAGDGVPSGSQWRLSSRFHVRFYQCPRHRAARRACQSLPAAFQSRAAAHHVATW